MSKTYKTFDPSKTQQQFRYRSDPRKIVERSSGKPRPIASEEMVRRTYIGQFESGDDFHTMQQRVLNAQLRFDALPAELKQALRHDPANLIELVERVGNGDQEAIDFAADNRLIKREYHSEYEKTESRRIKEHADLREKVFGAFEAVIEASKTSKTKTKTEDKSE